VLPSESGYLPGCRIWCWVALDADALPSRLGRSWARRSLGRGLPDIGHVAYDLRKHIDKYVWTDKKTGKVWKPSEHWRVVSLTARAHE
jgi:hypothetical protein